MRQTHTKHTALCTHCIPPTHPHHSLSPLPFHPPVAVTSSRASASPGAPRRAAAFVHRLAKALSSRRSPSSHSIVRAWCSLVTCSTRARQQAFELGERRERGLLLAAWEVMCDERAQGGAARELASAQGALEQAQDKTRELASAQWALEQAQERASMYAEALMAAAARRKGDALRRRALRKLGEHARRGASGVKASIKLEAVRTQFCCARALDAWRWVRVGRFVCELEGRALTRLSGAVCMAWRGRTLATARLAARRGRIWEASFALWRGRAAASQRARAFIAAARARAEREGMAGAMRGWRGCVQAASLRVEACLKRSVAAWGAATYARRRDDEGRANLAACLRRLSSLRVSAAALAQWRIAVERWRCERKDGEREELMKKLKSAEGALMLLLDSGIVGAAKIHSGKQLVPKASALQ